MGCRFTQYDIMRLREKREEFQAAGAQLFVVIQSHVKTVEEHFDTSLLDMTLLCDPESRLYQRFSVLPAQSEEEMHGKHFFEKIKKVEAAGLVGGKKEGIAWQLPAAFIIDPQNTVIYSYYGKEAADMPEPEQLLEVMK